MFQRNDPNRLSKGKLISADQLIRNSEAKIFLTDTTYPTFESLREKAFADKTMFLKNFLANEEINRITLPRAMGKTLLLKMVESFCDVEKVPGIPKRPNDEKRDKTWEGTEIKNESEFCKF
jgi:hypothetical protein